MNIISSNGIIRLHRGDTFQIPLYINESANLNMDYYDLTETDYVEFYLMSPNQKWEDALIIKRYTGKDYDNNNDCIYITLTNSDTKDLEPANYYYGIKLFKNNNEIVDTIIPKTKFILLD